VIHAADAGMGNTQKQGHGHFHSGWRLGLDKQASWKMTPVPSGEVSLGKMPVRPAWRGGRADIEQATAIGVGLPTIMERTYWAQTGCALYEKRSARAPNFFPHW